MTLTDILTHPLMAIFVTLGSFLLAQKIQEKYHGHNLLNPVVVAIGFVVIYLTALDIPHATYLQDVNIIHALLGPTTVALAVPLYNQLPLIKKSFGAILGAIFISSLVAAGTAYYLADIMGAAEDIKLAIIPKSTTTPIAIGIAEKINIQVSLAVFFVFTTGIIGTMIGAVVFKICRITDAKAIGLAFGTACHGLGVARAFQHNKQAGAFAALGMGLMGIVSGILLPALTLYFLKG